MRAVYGTEQLDVYTPVEAAAIQSDTSCPLLKSVSLRGIRIKMNLKIHH
jgi:hypothetical protein